LGAALVALALTSLLSLGLFAGSASARPTCPGRVVTIDGIGSSLQKVAQERAWRPRFVAECAETTVTYEALGSGEGLRAWHAEGRAGTAAESGKEFIATDDAPEVNQVRNMETAARGPISVVPVAQAAVAVVVHRPQSTCAFGPRGRNEITNEDLQKIWEGTFTRWEQVQGTCTGAITRIVRLGVSGTTYQFKHYLWLINRAAIGLRTWLQYQEPTENPNWPAAIRRETVEGGGQLVREVNANAGSIGYANYADALANPEERAETISLRVQNNGTVEPARAVFAEPEAAIRDANCLRTQYFNRLGKTNGGAQITEPTLALSWVEIYGSDPAIGTAGRERAYPICTLTWIGVALRYRTGTWGAGSGTTVKDYVKWIIEEGLTLIRELNYAGTPAEFREGARMAGREGTRGIVEGITEE
jgi:ABC-type phosphate transport system substrate-binding protein